MTRLQTVTCSHAGADLEGQIAIPVTPGPHPALLVMHNAHGLGDHMKSVAEQLAMLGYVAIATDMYGGGQYYADSDAIAPMIAPFFADLGLLRSRTAAWLEILKTRPEVDAGRVGALGYCFGGQCVLELARSGADLKLVVSYHGLLTTSLPAVPGTVIPHVAIYTGAKDPYAPREHVEAVRDELVAAGAHWQITEFGDAYHSFTDPHAAATGLADLAYDPLSDALSWAGTRALLEALL